MSTHRAKLLNTYLDALEGIVRKKLDDPRLFPDPQNSPFLDATDSLDSIAEARRELKQHPEGAALAFHVLGAALGIVRVPIELRRIENQMKGAHGGRQKGANNSDQLSLVKKFRDRWNKSENLQDQGSLVAYIHGKTEIPLSTIRRHLKSLAHQ